MLPVISQQYYITANFAANILKNCLTEQKVIQNLMAIF